MANAAPAEIERLPLVAARIHALDEALLALLLKPEPLTDAEWELVEAYEGREDR